MKKINVSLFVVLFALTASACDRTPLRTIVSDGASETAVDTSSATATKTDTVSATQTTTVQTTAVQTASDTATSTDTVTSIVTTTPTATVTTTATETQSDTVPVTVSQTATDTSTSTITATFEIAVTVDKVDALGNPAEDVRSFGIQFSSPAKDVDLVISTKESGVFHLEHVDYVPGLLYISPGNWAKKLQSDTTYQWSVTANAASPVIGSTSDVVYGEFTTAYCFIGEYKYHYTPDPKTDGVGRCHGAMMECIDNGHGSGMLSGAGEVTPYPWGDIAGNGIDDDCNGIIDDGEAYFCPVNDSTISQGCCMPNGSSFSRPSLSDLTHQPNAYILVKGSNSFVYLYATNDKRYVFTSKDVITSWFTSFDGGQLGDLQNVCNTVNELSDVELASITIGGNVTIRPGSDIVKIASDPALYVVARGKVLRKLATADLAEKIYPGSSAQRTRVIPEAFFVNYSIGLDVSNASDYDPAAEWAAADMETEAESPVVP